MNVFNNNEYQEKAEEKIKFYDSNGHQFEVSKTVYKEKVLPSQIEKAWNDANELYNVIVMALQDGFYEEVVLPAEQLFKIDNDKHRAYVILSIVLLKNKNYSEAKNILEEYISKYGKTGVVLTNLAKIYSEELNETKACEILNESMFLDPNQDNGLAWWLAIHFERGGKTEYVESLELLTKVKGSWRPQVFLAKEYLEKGLLQSALDLYYSLLKEIPNNQDVLTNISGDLGKFGHILESINLIEPIYDPSIHGPYAGLNLLQSYFQTRQYDKGLDLLTKIKKLERKDLMIYLENLESQFVKCKCSMI